MSVSEKSPPENKQHSSAVIPYSFYKCAVPDYFPCVPLHWHKETEISLIREGRGVFRCESRTVTAEKGDIIIIQPNMLHSIDLGEDLRYDTLVFSMDMISGGAGERSYTDFFRDIISSGSRIIFPVSQDFPRYDELFETAENIMTCAAEGTAVHDVLMKSELLKMFWLINEGGGIVRQDKPPHDNSSMRDILGFISENYAENITVEMLAERSFMSKSRFMAKFRQTAGIGAIGYLNKLRIKKVCELLEEGDMNISQAALECGFRNLSNFNRQFRSVMGLSPAEYAADCGRTKKSCRNTF